jgi:hypothetical protein
MQLFNNNITAAIADPSFSSFSLKIPEALSDHPAPLALRA